MKIKKFLNEVVLELKKVSWSTKEELFTSTWVVISITFILTLYIGAADFILARFLSILIK